MKSPQKKVDWTGCETAGGCIRSELEDILSGGVSLLPKGLPRGETILGFKTRNVKICFATDLKPFPPIPVFCFGLKNCKHLVDIPLMC